MLNETTTRRVAGTMLLIATATWLAACDEQQQADRTRRPAAVEVAPVVQADITLRRTYTGSLEAAARYTASPEIEGRVKRIHVDLGDRITRGQLMVELDDAEARQQVAQARAELAVAEANAAEARSGLEIADRELARVTALRKRGIASDTRLDGARAAQHAAAAKHQVAQAQIARAQAALQGARIRLGYTRITAAWEAGDDQRVVAERFVDEGETVPADAALLSIVELDPIIGVLHVPERDYTRMEVGKTAILTTDAYPGERFEARIRRIAPVFQPGSRQARVELLFENPKQRLKPGLFIRATLQVETARDATVVPLAALAKRSDEPGVFLVQDGRERVTWRKVEVGIREGERVQILGQKLSGRVVTLGQQLLDDGAAISIIDSGGGGGDPK